MQIKHQRNIIFTCKDLGEKSELVSLLVQRLSFFLTGRAFLRKENLHMINLVIYQYIGSPYLTNAIGSGNLVVN